MRNYLTVMFLLLALTLGCASGPDVKNPTGPLAASLNQINAATRDISNAVKAVRGNIQEAEKDYPEVANAVRSNVNSIDGSAARIAAATTDIAVRSAEYADMPKTIEKLEKQLEKARDEATSKGRWLFYGLIVFGILGAGACVYGLIQAPSMSNIKRALGAAAACVVIVGLAVGFLWYGTLIVKILFGGVGLIGIAVLVYLGLKWKSLLKQTAETFDDAEKVIGVGKVTDKLKAAWSKAQEKAGIKGVLADVRGK